ncbi:putative cell division cycle protein 27-like protein B isoform X1, partial [Sesbania bispinosa]
MMSLLRQEKFEFFENHFRMTLQIGSHSSVIPWNCNALFKVLIVKVVSSPVASNQPPLASIDGLKESIWSKKLLSSEINNKFGARSGDAKPHTTFKQELNPRKINHILEIFLFMMHDSQNDE